MVGRRQDSDGTHAVAGPSAVVDSSGFLRSPAGQQLWASRGDNTVLFTIRPNSDKVLPGIAFGTSSQSRLRLFSLRIRRPQLTGCRRVVRPRGESPGRVASQSGYFPWEIRSCPVYGAAPGGPAPGRKPWSVLAGMQVPRVAKGCLWVAAPPPPPFPVRDKTPPSTDVVIYGFPPSPPGRGAKDPKP